VVTDCGACVNAATLPTAVANSYSTAPVQTAVASCVQASVSVAVKTCLPLRVKACQFITATGTCGFANDGDYQNCVKGVNTPPPVTVCQGLGNPCGCPYAQGCVYYSVRPSVGAEIAVCTTPVDAAIQAAKFQDGNVATTVDTNGVVMVAAPSGNDSSGNGSAGTGVATGGAVASAQADASATRISTLTVAPSVCTANTDLKTADVASVSASSAVAAAIVQKGFDTGVATSTLSENLAKLSPSAELTHFLIVIVAMSNPVTAGTGVSLSTFVDVIGTGQPSAGALDTLCDIVKTCLAASCGADATKFVGCDHQLVSSAPTPVKRDIFAANSTDTSRYSFSTVLPGSTSGVSTVTVSIVALLVALLRFIM